MTKSVVTHPITLAEHDHAPLFTRFKDLFSAGFSIDWGITTFLVISHLIALIAVPISYAFAPEGLWPAMLAWTLAHAFVGSLATTVYSHRLIAHNAVKVIRWPVHVLFLGLQLFAVQGSVRRWAAMHVVHHSVDRTGRDILDPYSATWFKSGWRNFLWSHMVTYFFHHPDSREFQAAYARPTHPAVVWQDRHYVSLMIAANYVAPGLLGLWLAGWLGGLCMMLASVAGYVLAQQNTWTVNSITHMWGFKRALTSSAKNNFIWLGPLGEGHQHADHHDYPRDFRNGFGRVGWFLDPTRYVILTLRGFNLVEGLNRASRAREAQIIAGRKLRDARAWSPQTVWQQWEGRLQHLQDEWLEAAKTWDDFKQRKAALAKQMKAAGTARLEATQERFETTRARLDATQREMADELDARIKQLKVDIELAKRRFHEQREAFFLELQRLRDENLALAQAAQ